MASPESPMARQASGPLVRVDVPAVRGGTANRILAMQSAIATAWIVDGAGRSLFGASWTAAMEARPVWGVFLGNPNRGGDFLCLLPEAACQWLGFPERPHSESGGKPVRFDLPGLSTETRQAHGGRLGV